jgi:hypothetical protein
MAKVGNIVLYLPKEGRENDLLELVKKHWAAAHSAGLTTDDPARVWRATDRRTGKVSFVERFFWIDEEASSRAHHHPGVQAVWVPMDAVLEDMTILVIEEVAGHPPVSRGERASATTTRSRATSKRAKKSGKSRVKMRKSKPVRPMAKRRAPSARGRGRRATRTTRKGTRRR